MPDYPWLGESKIDPAVVQNKMETLGFPYSPEQIKDLNGKTELDAMVAYLQKLGSDIPWRKAAETTIVGDLINPFPGDAEAISAGKAVYAANCAACHGEQLEGIIGPDLTDLGMDDADLYQILHNGVPDGGMPGFSSLGSTKVWQLVNFLNSGK